jgi:iron complex outermembrane receptor protein
MRNHIGVPFAALAANVALPLSGLAADNPGRTLEEVIVTAQRREQSLQDVPVAVSVVSADTIRELSLQNLDQLSSYVPGFNVREGGEQTAISLRGFATGLNFGFDQSVGLFIDGIYAGRERQFRSTFLDIGSVEVLKGPQATLFGKNTTAGAVIINTGRATHDFLADVSADFSSEIDRQVYTAVVNGGLTDTLAGRLALRYSQEEGYLRNTFTNEREEQGEDWIARMTFEWTPSDALSVRAKLEHSEYERIGRNFNISSISGVQVGRPTCFGMATGWPCAAAAADVGPEARLSSYRAYDPDFPFGSFDQTSKQRETADVEANNVAIRAEYEFSPDTKLVSISGYSSYDSEDQRDVDWSPTDFLYEPITQEFDQYSQELQLLSKIGERFEYLAGVHAFRNEFYVDRRTDIDIRVFLLPFGVQPTDPLIFGGPASDWRYAQLRFLDQETESVAAYFSGTYHFTPSWSLTAGLRWNREDKSATDRYALAEFGTTRFLNVSRSGGALVGDPADVALISRVLAVLPANVNGIINTSRTGIEETLTETDWSPELTLSWDVNADTMLYVRGAQGHKGGGFNSATVGQDASDRTFDDETVTGFELGGKLRLLGGTAALNFALFHQEFKDLQTSTWVGDGFDVGNAGKSRSRGLELETLWRATEKLRLNAGLIWLDARFLENTGNACSIPQRFFPDPVPGCVFTPANPAAGVPASFLQDNSGDRFAPTFSGNFGIGYTAELTNSLDLQLRADLVYTGRQRNALDPTIEQGSRALLDVGATLRPAGGNSWSIGLLVQNATDKEFYWYEFEAPSQIGTRIGFPGPPRMLTLQTRYRF